MKLLNGVALEASEREAFARGLFVVAAGDGVDDREEALIERFGEESGAAPGLAARIAELPRITGEELAAAVPDGDKRLLFLKLALILARADGRVSLRENRAVLEFVLALGLRLGAVEQLEREADAWVRADLARGS